MATTITQGFSKLRSNLEITSLQSSIVSTRQLNVRDVVRAGLDTNDDFLTGSYRRSTMIAPLTKADVRIASTKDLTLTSLVASAKILP